MRPKPGALLSALYSIHSRVLLHGVPATTALVAVENHVVLYSSSALDVGYMYR